MRKAKSGKGVSKKKKILILILVPILLIASVGGVLLWMFFGKNAAKNNKNRGFGNGNYGGFGGNSISINTDGKVTASGVTNVGTVSESFDVTELETQLKIEKVYVASGDSLKAGDKILKLSEDSVADARKELQDKLRDAELSYRTGTIEYERDKISAEYDKDSTKLEGMQANAVYQDSMLDVAQDVETAQSKLDEAKAQIQEYAKYLDGDARAYFKIDEYQKLYDENLKLLTDNMEKWGITWPQVTSGATGGSSASSGSGSGSFSGGSFSGSSGSGMPSGTTDFSGMSGMPSGSSDFSGMSGTPSDAGTSASTGSGSVITVTATDEYSQWVTILKNLYNVLEQNAKDLENAKTQYENAISTASLEKKLLELSLPELEENLAEAKADYEKAVLQNQLTKEKSLSNADRAEHDYETALEKAESDYEVLKSAWEDAKKNLEIFEEQVGDGFFYASADGTVLRSSVRAGNSLRAESTVITYSDLSAMTVTVSVDQSDIAKITPGEAVLVASQKGAMLDGVVKSVNPVSNSDSRNNVTYSVTVELDGSGALGSNESVTVIFGMTTADVQGSTGGNGSGGDGSGRPSWGDGQMPSWGDGQMPEGFDGQMPSWGDGQMPNFGDGQMPEGFDGQMPSWGDGQMPNFGDGQMPNFGDGQMPEGFSGQMPNFGGGERPEGGNGERPSRDGDSGERPSRGGSGKPGGSGKSGESSKSDEN